MTQSKNHYHYLAKSVACLSIVVIVCGCSINTRQANHQSPVIEASDGAMAGWMPTPPLPDQYDWIKLTSGEWLKGELITLYEDSITFDSDILGLLTIDADDIEELRSHNRKSLRFNDGSVIEGQIYIKGEFISLIGAGMRLYQRDQLVSIAYAETDGERQLWDSKISISANLRRGNTEQEDYMADFEVFRRTASNRLNIKYTTAYTTNSGQEIENNQRLTSQYDIFFSQKTFFRPVGFELFSDSFQNISYRLTYSVGAGYRLINTNDSNWDISAGLGFQTTRFETVEKGEDRQKRTPVLQFGTDYDYDITDDLNFHFKYSGQRVNTNSGQYNHHLETGLEIDLLSDIDFEVTFIWDRISKPTKDSDGITPDKDDTRLVFGLGYNF